MSLRRLNLVLLSHYISTCILLNKEEIEKKIILENK